MILADLHDAEQAIIDRVAERAPEATPKELMELAAALGAITHG